MRDKRPADSVCRDARPRHSHRNLNLREQMVVAESLFDPDLEVEHRSRLSISLSDVEKDAFVQAYFHAYADSQDVRTGNLIKLWIGVSRFRSGFGSKSEPVDAMAEAQRLLMRWNADPDLRKVLPDCLYDRLEHRMQSADLDSGMFDPVLDAIWGLVQVSFITFLSSQFFLKYQIDLMTKGHISLSDVLFYDATLFYFRHFMQKQGMHRYLHFVLVAHSTRHSPHTAVDHRMIWKKFFHQDTDSEMDESSHYLFLSHQMSQKVEQQMFTQNADCWQKPAALVHQYLQKTYFTQFLESPEFLEMTTELIRKFQQMQVAYPVKRSKSEDGLSVQESLPSTGTTDTSVACTSELTSGRRAVGLQILHVDPYGRLISDLEPEPDKRQERSYLSQSIRKLVRRSVSNQDANQALAWKLAQIIIDDVVNVTAEYT